MKKRSIALLLCAAILMSLFPVMSTLAYDSSPITVTASSTTLPENADKDNGSVTLTAAPASDSVSPTNYHWQIQIPSANLWVDITGASGAKLDVTYAMVASALSGKTASLRAAATVNGETAYSEAVKLTVGAALEPAATQTTALTPKVLSQAKATTTPTTAPTTAPTEAPAADTAALEKAVTDAEASLKAAQEALTAAQAKVEPAKAAQTAAAQAVTDAETALSAAKAALETPAEGANTEDLQAAVTAAESKLAEVTDQRAIADATAVKAESDAKLAADAVTAAETALKDAKAALEAAKTPAAAPVRRAPAISLFANESNTNTTYSVVINYVFENNGGIAADPYTATLAAGSNFSATVNHPTVQGYLPYVGNVTETSTGIDLNITDIQADVIYTVTYKPTNVDYTVIHYQQNVENDNYTEVARETKQGLTNSTVPEVANKYDGFYALLYEKPAIAADGSTVVEVYYDRYYYLMNFDLDGGYGVEPIYARYGASIGNVGTPTKAGYNFAGWSETKDGEVVDKLPATMPSANRTYYAIWSANNTAKVTVVFWGENANDEEYSYIKSAEVNVKPGTKFTYSEDGTLICVLEPHTHSASCGYNCGQTEHTHGPDCYTLTCTQTVHTTHSTGCYDGVDGETWSGSTAKPQNPKEGQVYEGRLGTYIYINGTWYDYSGSTKSGQIAPTTCHSHTDYTGDCYEFTCKLPEHTHSDSCYACGKAEHSHTESCYMNGAGLDAAKYYFVKSDTVTVAPDGSSIVNVYYDRVEYSVTFASDGRYSSEYQNLRITAKWGASILDKWPTYSGSSSWYVENDYNEWNRTWQNSLQIMPVGGEDFYGPKTGSSDYTAYYYVEALPGATDTVTHNGVTYVLHHKDVSSSEGNVTDEERYEIEGFTYKEGTANGQSFNNAKFYYTRNTYNLTFSDGFDEVRKETVKYQAPLSTYADFKPEVPSAYEPGSVTFGGWYLNPECTGVEYKLSEHTMPSANVLLYAKWVPVSHTVSFYLDKDASEEVGNDIAFGQTGSTKLCADVNVSHGSKIDADSVPTATNGNYKFIGWFYMDGNTEKAIDFANMPINKDLKVYGKWSSNVLKNYFIYYKVQGEDTEVAAPTTGSGLAGITKTFDAKGGTDLYAAYQEGYFPVVKSHSLTIDIKNEANNSFTFWYVQKDAVPYTVHYVTEKQNADGTLEAVTLNGKTYYKVADSVTDKDNRKAVVTETFKPVSGYLPDAYQKRLVVSAEEGAVNEIIFYYTEDTTHAYYKISHFTQNTDGENWTEYASSQAVGTIGETYSADPMTIPGFTYDSSVTGTVTSGELTANGLELKLYYVRNSYPYEVRYLEQGSGTPLAEPKTCSALYGKVISESAIDIANYTPVDPTAQSLTIKIEEGTDAKLNVITFYYKENEATINYEVVGPDGCGTVTPTSETLKVLSGTAQGSTAAANDNFRFLGWYSDAECTTKVSDDLHYPPTKGENDVWTNVTYYAKFEHDVTTLTITKSGANETLDPGQSFIFIVKGENLPTNGLKVTVTGNTSVTIGGLKVGSTYTITEVSDWSWRYTAKPVTTDPLVANCNTVTVTNVRTKDLWLDGNSVSHNVFK